ncbi:MAG: penicillin-insensitive murein endopeptidase [Myxococcales bacterium]|nr:penicillin-insensitive murein endopeptidase [Myxococcales bacterium]
MVRGRLLTLLSLALFACAARTPTAPPPAAPSKVDSATAAASPLPERPASPAEGADSEYLSDGDDEPDDGDQPGDNDVSAPPATAAPRPPHPLDGKSKSEIARSFEADKTSIGSVTLGRPGAGALLNGVQMPRAEGWILIDPANAYGTQETVDFLRRAISKVREQFPGSHDVFIGHISSRRGGPLRPHMSHQAGRDVDLSYFYSDDSARWYRRADASNLDLPRTWAFVRAFVTETDAELILIDHSLQKLLRQHALDIREDPAWIASLFDGIPGVLRPLIFHAKGHATHLHVRFFNPIAQETAVLAHDVLAAHGYQGAATAFITHRTKKGETLGMLAKKYRVTVREIMRENGLRTTKIRAKQPYRIPRKGALGRPPHVSIPPRRLPPTSAARNKTP